MRLKSNSKRYKSEIKKIRKCIDKYKIWEQKPKNRFSWGKKNSSIINRSALTNSNPAYTIVGTSLTTTTKKYDQTLSNFGINILRSDNKLELTEVAKK